jgi:hypothetical protein
VAARPVRDGDRPGRTRRRRGVSAPAPATTRRPLRGAPRRCDRGDSTGPAGVGLPATDHDSVSLQRAQGHDEGPGGAAESSTARRRQEVAMQATSSHRRGVQPNKSTATTRRTSAWLSRGQFPSVGIRDRVVIPSSGRNAVPRSLRIRARAGVPAARTAAQSEWEEGVRWLAQVGLGAFRRFPSLGG